VGAYIRHQYTDYDKMLKSDGCTWHEARAKAQSASYAKLKEWRDEGDGPELEDTFREIIVLDDDEDGESESSDDASDVDERQDSLEIFSSRATGRELQPETFAPVRRQDAHRMRSVYPAFSATHEPRHLIPARSQPFSQRVTPQTIAPQYEPPSYNWAPGRAKEPYVHVPATMGPLDFAHMSSLPTTTPPGTVVIDGRLHYVSQPLDQAQEDSDCPISRVYANLCSSNPAPIRRRIHMRQRRLLCIGLHLPSIEMHTYEPLQEFAYFTTPSPTGQHRHLLPHGAQEKMLYFLPLSRMLSISHLLGE
jgi:hypothetical protein